MSQTKNEIIRSIIDRVKANPAGAIGYDLTYVGKQYTIQELLNDLDRALQAFPPEPPITFTEPNEEG